ncbi:unnamed protein product [Ilex paraguariensis]|uniref:Uncharacterized protein n=1 Tax=Ilex paraguariensis TaxID=185542 RepID=A0ABC8RKQ4_9AQUA
MLRQSPSRNPRSKGIKGKHVLQICLLLAVCFWLIYQVKHSHDKRKEFDKKDAMDLLNAGSGNEILRFGRKDLYPRVEETETSNEQREEAAEEGEAAGEEEENKSDEDEQEEGNRTEEKEDAERGGGEDEIDEEDQEKSNAEIDHEEDFIDDEEERKEGDGKESEEKDDDDKDGQMEDDSSLEDHDHEGAGNTHEAREEHYKADDASSAVAHDTQIVRTENGTGSLEHSDEHSGMNTLEQENKVNNTEEVDVGQIKTSLKMGDGEIAENGSPLHRTADEEKSSGVVSPKPEDVSLLNTKQKTEANDQSQLSNSSTEASTETLDLTLQNGTKTISDFTEVQNLTVGGTTYGKGSNLRTIALEQANTITTDNHESDSKVTIFAKPEAAEAKPRESSNSFTKPVFVVSENVVRSNTSVAVEHSSEFSRTEELTDATHDEKSDTVIEMNKTDENSGSSQTENAEVHNDPIDSSDSSLPLEETLVRTDLETLPEIRTEGSKMEDAAAAE